MPARKKTTQAKDSTADLGFETKLCFASGKLRHNKDVAEYKHVVLRRIFLKYISDSFEEHHAKLEAGEGDYAGADPEDPDEYRAENVFWVPPAVRWSHLENSATQFAIGKIVADAMVAIECDNPRLNGVLPKDYARPAMDKHRLGELIDLVGTIGLGDKENRAKGGLGRVYEYFLTMFAKRRGQERRPVLQPVLHRPPPRPCVRLRRHVRLPRAVRLETQRESLNRVASPRRREDRRNRPPLPHEPRRA